VIAPAYLLATVVALIRAPMSPATWCFCSPLAVSVVLPATLLPRVGMWAMALYPFRMIPYYFDYEEFHEMRDVELLEKHEKGERVIACMHPHGVFPFVSVCAFVVSLCEPTGMGTKFVDWPTAVASVIRLLPILKDVLGLFGIIEASQAVLKKRLSRRKGSCILYVGGMIELFRSSPTQEAVFLKQRKGFIKLALRTGADVMPCYLFGNTTALVALTWAPLAAISRRIGVSVTVFWGRWGLPVPKPVKLTYARGRPLGLPHIPEPTMEDVDKYHALYSAKLVELFDRYKGFNPDYADKTLVIE